MAEPLYSFGSFALENQRGLLYRDGELIPLAPKVAQTLLILVRNHGQVVEKEAILSSVWPNSFVEEGNLHHNISVLRKLLRSDGGSGRIETIPKRGYRFVGEVQAMAELPAARIDPRPPAMSRQWPRVLTAGVPVVLCVALAVFLLGSRMPAGRQTKSLPPANSLAVLPFSNLSSDPQVDYLGDGLTDELIHELTRVSGLRVVGRTSTFQFKGKSVDLRQIGSRLQARLILEGSVQKEGNQLRVMAQLIDAETGLHLWSERFDRRFDDVFAIQDEICRAIAGELSVELSGPAGSWRGVQKTANLEVYTLYLRGLKEWNRRNRAGVQAARGFFDRALALDPAYAPAWAGLADTLVHSGIWSIVPPNQSFPKAKAAALRAIELNSQLAEPHTVLGYIQGWYERNHHAAEASFRRALDINPGYSWGRQRLASYLSALGRHEEAIGELHRAIELDPISTSANSGLALTFFWARQYDRAIEQCAKTREIDPQFPLTYYYLAHSLEQKHRYEEAIVAMREGMRLWGSTDGVMLTELYAATPVHRAEALNRLAEVTSPPVDNQPYQMAIIFTALGDKEKALWWLDQASRGRDTWALYANVDPRLDALRSDRRFQQLLKSLGFG